MTTTEAAGTTTEESAGWVPSPRMVALFQEMAAATAGVRDGVDRERADLLETLRTHRVFLRHTLTGLTEEQARLRPTASSLCVGGLVKHVAATEAQWADFIERGPSAMSGDVDGYAAEFEMQPSDTVASVLARYAEVAARTDALVRSLPDLGVEHPLPSAPWFTPGERRTARRVVLHLIAETSQHAGHADILRESIDGGRTMG